MITLTESETLRARIVGAAEPAPQAEQWCWCIEEQASHGPFGSRDEALRDAADSLDDDFRGHVCVSRIVDVDPAHYAAEAVSLDGLLERADEIFADVCSTDDHVFYVDNEAEAEADLRSALAAWARKHMGTNCPWRAEDSPDAADEIRAVQAGRRGAL
jgi:hypothetical protein